MSIKTLQFCQPFYTIKAVQDEKEYKICNKSIVINLSESDVMVRDKPVCHLKSTIVTNINKLYDGR